MARGWLRKVTAGMLTAALVFGTVQTPVKANEAANISILDSAHEVVNGKMLVSFDIQNGGSGSNVGFAVIGYDADGRVIETAGDSSYLMGNEIETYEVELESGSQIKKVDIVPVGEGGDQAVLLASGWRADAKSVEVSGVVHNANKGRNVGVMAVGYDASGKIVEVKAADAYLMGSEVTTFNVPLSAVKLIKKVEVSVVDVGEDAIKLLKSGSRLENGQLIISGAVQNRHEGGRIGVVIVGSSASGKVLEVNTTSGYLTGSEIGNFEAKLEAGKAIAGVKVFLTGTSETPQVIAEGMTRINNKLVATVGVQNGSKAQRITVKSTAYDAKGRSLGSDTDSWYLSANDSTTFRISYYDSKVTSVKLKYYDEAGNEIGTKPIRVKINGQLQTYAQAPVMVNGSVLVPMRPIFESLDASVKWDQKTQTVHSAKGATSIKLTIGSKQATVNGKGVALDTAPRTVRGSTMVPLRFVASALGCEVKWDKDEQMVLITTK